VKYGNNSQDKSIFLLLAMALILALGSLVVLRVLRSDPVEDALERAEIINILFVFEGAPDGEGRYEKPLASFVLMYSPANNRAAVIAIPGEVGLILKTIDRVDRIDSVYRSGRIAAYITEIENLLEIKIGYSLVVSRDNLVKAVDLLEGVELFNPQPVEIYEDVPLLFPSGNTVLDGDKALQFISFEIPEEDRGQPHLRRERFFMGFLKSLRERNLLLQNSQMAGAFYPLFKSELPKDSKIRLFNALAVLDLNRVSLQPVAGNYREVSGQELLFPYYDAVVIKDIVRQAQRSLSRDSAGALVERVYTVEVLNGTTTAGLASRTAELIRGFRYEVVGTGNADRNDYEKTEIIDRTGFEDVVNVFAETIRCRNIRGETAVPGLAAGSGAQRSGAGADFTLIIGRDFNGRVVTGN
jgi:anionic cell wall polymer biosynthesis LytR-Cps2A-Psr (LCP) family protein